MKSMFVKLAAVMLLAAAVTGCEKDENEQPEGLRYAFAEEQTVVNVTPQTVSFDLECLYLWPITDETIYIQLPIISVDKALSTAVEGEDFTLPEYGEGVTLEGNKFSIPVKVVADKITEEKTVVFVIDDDADQDQLSQTTVILRPAAE